MLKSKAYESVFHTMHMLQHGIVKVSTSPCSSAIVTVPKYDGSIRIYNDSWRLNDITTFDEYCLPSDLLITVSLLSPSISHNLNIKKRHLDKTSMSKYPPKLLQIKGQPAYRIRTLTLMIKNSMPSIPCQPPEPYTV